MAPPNVSATVKGERSALGEIGPNTWSQQTTQDSDSDDSALIKSGIGTSNNRLNDSYKKKPAVSKLEQNGFSIKDKQKSNAVLGKRPLDQAEEKDDDDDDDLPLAARFGRLKKPSSSHTKSSSVKQKATPASFNKANKLKNYGMKFSCKKQWTSLVHNGVILPPPYKPHGVKMLYNGKPVDLTPEQEEVATMFAVMKKTEHVKKPLFKENFWKDWEKILGTNHVIKDLDKCDFTPIYRWHIREKKKKKRMTAQEKKALKEEEMKLEEKYMWAVVDGVKEKVGNFRVEPPGLFLGRGEHPKMGMLKRRIRPSDITINIGKDAPVPECPIPGEKWKEITHDDTVPWLAFWSDPNPIVSKECKYMLSYSSKEDYMRAADFTQRQIADATYLIDKLALSAGNEKEEDAVGCGGGGDITRDLSKLKIEEGAGP